MATYSLVNPAGAQGGCGRAADLTGTQEAI